jgi:folate-binding protein YgfZ
MTTISPAREVLVSFAQRQAGTRAPAVAAADRPGAASGRPIKPDDSIETLPYVVVKRDMPARGDLNLMPTSCGEVNVEVSSNQPAKDQRLSSRRGEFSTLTPLPKEEGEGPDSRPAPSRGQAIRGDDGSGPYPSPLPQGQAVNVEIVAAYGPVELEYAAIRRGVGLMDCPQRGTLIVTGGDSIEFLNRMLTQDVKSMRIAGGAAESFWLNRKGRIEGDVLLAELGSRMLIDVDIHQVASVKQTLGAYIITEDVAIKDASDQLHQVQLHGPRVLDLLRGAARVREAATGTIGEWAQNTLANTPSAASLEIAGAEVAAVRRDQAGVAGVALITERDHAAAVCEALLAAKDDNGQPFVRPIGWYAWNVARVEAGTPVMNIDFSTESLPHETGLVQQRVSFKKGCYLGQEIVARMQSLGKPKQQLVGLRLEEDALPVGGAQVFTHDDPANPVGVVTSSTLSPMLGSVPIALVMMKSAHAASGTKLLVSAEGRQARAVVADLPFWRA